MPSRTEPWEGIYAGIMTGTSMDAVDVCAIEIAVEPPIRLIAAVSAPIPPTLTTALHELVTPGYRTTLDHIAKLDHRLGRLYVDALTKLLVEHGINDTSIRAIGSHGQTIAHHPGGPSPYTWQIGDPNLLANATGITVVADLRRRDVAAGGQGAPLVPLFHQAIVPRLTDRTQIVINIGGIANITIIPSNGSELLGFDTGPGNTLMDLWARHTLKQPFDRDGKLAASGQIHPEFLANCLADSYFCAPPPKSTGREYFNWDWLHQQRLPKQLSSPDVQATLCELTAHTIADAVNRHTPTCADVWICGGGCYNKTLMQRLRHHLAAHQIADTTGLGIPPDWVEAAAFAWLAYRAVTGQVGNAPSVTGAQRATLLGAIYPGKAREYSMTRG